MMRFTSLYIGSMSEGILQISCRAFSVPSLFDTHIARVYTKCLLWTVVGDTFIVFCGLLWTVLFADMLCALVPEEVSCRQVRSEGLLTGFEYLASINGTSKTLVMCNRTKIICSV